MKKAASYGGIIFLLFFHFVFSLPSFSQGSGLKAVSDTIDLVPGIPVEYNILANDTLPAGDTLNSVSAGGEHITCKVTHGTTWVFTFLCHYWGNDNEVLGKYTLRTKSNAWSSATILFRIRDHSFGYLDINNVRARFSAFGNHFHHDSAEYEVPKGSGKTSIFSNAFWIGGKDVNGQLHLAGERYGQGAGFQSGIMHDFFAGPVMDSVRYSIYQDTVWNYVWNLKKSEIDYHRAHFWEAGYTPIHDILTWPGNGDTTLGQAFRLAPFSDRNGNGIYEPYDGDYPEIRGDQALYFIFNDDRDAHTETTGTKLGVEIHGMAYGFDMAEDSALKNTVFLNYKIFNRSGNTYDSTMFGIFTDIDLGYANDDYIGCDVERNSYYGFNGYNVDGNGQSNAYGAHPPAVSVTLLGGPYMDPDGIDNPRFDGTGHQLCDASVNGLNFGDSVIDNERLGLQVFFPLNQLLSGIPGGWVEYPTYAPDYYLVMQGYWGDSTRLEYGGNGRIGVGAYGPECRFMFPGESDTLNWGVGCTAPNGPQNWTERTAGNNPNDKKGVGSTGPVTFKPGDVQEMDIAFIWARDYTDTNSVGKLRQMIDSVTKDFRNNKLPNGNVFYGVNDSKKPSAVSLRIYPNPATDKLNIVFGQASPAAGASVELINNQGSCVKNIFVSGPGDKVSMDISGVPAGFYFIRVMSEEAVVVRKVVIQ